MSDRTPGPWRVDPKKLLRIVASDDDSIASTGLQSDLRDQWEANAAAIVRWENHFDDLVRALENITLIKNKDFGPDWEEIEEAREIARDALAKVKS